MQWGAASGARRETALGRLAQIYPGEGLVKKHRFQKFNGAQGRDRTTDTAIFSRMLYQLSYLGPPRR